MDSLLDRIYLDETSNAYLAGVQTVYRAAKALDSRIKLKDVQHYLEKQNTHTLHRPTRIRFPRNRIVASGVDDSDWEIDLIDLQPLKRFNNNNAYILVCIDQFSKMLWAEPTKTKKPTEVLEAFKKILDSGRSPWAVRADRGMEWNEIKKFLAEKQINFIYATSPDVKCATVERAIRTVKQRFWKHFTKTNKFNYMKILPKIVNSINRTPSRVSKHRPVDVNKDNEEVVRSILYDKPPPKPVKHKYSVGDLVRISTERGTFAKGYMPRYSTEVFQISERLRYRRPATYRLIDKQGEKIDGIFYEPELVRCRE